MSKEWTPDTIFDLISDEIARAILELASDAPISAEVLAEQLDVSLPTIYRRINGLQEFDLIEEGVHVDDDGNHFKRFLSGLSEMTISLDDGRLHADVVLDGDLTDRFSEFFDDLGAGVDTNQTRRSHDSTGLGNRDTGVD